MSRLQKNALLWLKFGRPCTDGDEADEVKFWREHPYRNNKYENIRELPCDLVLRFHHVSYEELATDLKTFLLPVMSKVKIFLLNLKCMIY